MNSIRKHFLAGPAFADKQNWQIGWRDFADDVLEVPGSTTGARNPVRVFPAHFSMRRVSCHGVDKPAQPFRTLALR